MEGDLAMLRQLIGEFEELLELYPRYPPHSYLHPHSQLLQPPPHYQQRLCFMSHDDKLAEDGCCNIIMRAGKPGNFKMVEPSNKPPPAKKLRKENKRGRLPDATCSTEMDYQIWKEFPEDLFETVIARLPIASFFRFRSVCSKWSSLLTSHSFSQQFAQLHQKQPWFYTIAHENGSTEAMYDPTLKKWHHLTIPSLQTKLIVLPVASAGGLVCFLDIGHRSFYVCNPLTQSFKELPARSIKVWARVAVGMTLNGESSTGDYKILWVSCDGEYEVYDSVKNYWTRPGNMPSGITLPLYLSFRSQAVSIGATLYFMRYDPDGIISYNMVSGVWQQFVIPAPLDLSDHTLAECGGRILLVGLLTKNAATCVCVWELQKMTLLWTEVDRMPNVWCLEFYGKHVRMTCLGNKGLFLLSLRSRQMNRLVTYDVVSREWVKVPGSVLPRGRKRQWIASGTAFHPCLTASA